MTPTNKSLGARRLPRVLSATLVLLLSGLGAAGCSPAGDSPATSESSVTIASAVPGDKGPATDTEKALERIAQAISSDSEAVSKALPGMYGLIGARRIQDWAVEFVYRYQDPVDSEIQAAVIASNTAPLESYMTTAFFPIATRLNVPDAYLFYSYFQPNGDHIITISCYYVPEGDWLLGFGGKAKAGGDCSESLPVADAYRSGELVAP